MKLVAKIAKSVGALVVAATVAVSVPAAAQELLVGWNSYETDPAVVQGLMTPIEPLVGTSAGSTTGIIQLGNSNTASSMVQGSGSLALVQQAGNNNRAVQAIDGSNSAMLLVQGGSNNSVAQVSQGNNNFQLVGVSGSNNEVAYVQSGDFLAGALDVRNSTNSTVLAFQTPQSGNYMMPSGLNGLKNQVVVVVPGRMYVLPKR